MGSDHQVLNAAQIKCGSCSGENDSNAKFCEGCGHTLHEPCGVCGKAVLLTQKFCGSCGADLEKSIQQRQRELEQWLTEAVSSTKEGDFERALGLLSRVARVTDYRFKTVIENAKTAITKVKMLQTRAENNRDEIMAKAKLAIDQGDNPSAIRLLESLPVNMISEESKKTLTRMKHQAGEQTELEREVRDAIAEKDWARVGGLLDHLLTLSPEQKSYARLAKQVSEKLMTSASRAVTKGNYEFAWSQINAVPKLEHSDDYRKQLSKVAEIRWLANQFSEEPFATPMLGKLAVRFAKSAPQDPRAHELISSLAARLKHVERAARNPLPSWQASPDSWLGGKVAMLGFPQSIDLRGHELLHRFPGRFNVSFGLALQGLGHGRVTEHFGPKQRLLGSLRKKKSRCWGLDLGSATAKAVLLEESEGQFKVIDCFFAEYSEPICRLGDARHGATATTKPVLDRFLKTKEVNGIPIWVNLPNTNTVDRFVRLPPVTCKQANSLLNKEIEHKIPIPADDLNAVRWIGKAKDDGLQGRPSFLSVVRRNIVDDRLQLLSESGLQISGLQSDAIALINFATTEFAELSSPENQTMTDDNSSENSLTMSFLDCGASGTTLILVSNDAHWIWTIESGGEDITAKISRTTKSTRSQAEQIKRNPADIESPSWQYEPVEQHLMELRARLETVFANAKKQNSRFQTKSTWCFGGACMAHEWIRLVTMKSQVSGGSK